MPPERLNQRGRHLSWHVHGPLVLLLVLAGCQLPTGSPTSEPTASAGASAAAAECPSIDLRTPQGTRIDLTGAWSTGSAEAGDRVKYEIRQSGECLWGQAFSAYQGQEPGESFDMILVGTVRSDFTVEVELFELRVGDPVYYRPFGRASATLAIRFEGAPGDEAVSLEIIAIHARVPAGGTGGRLYGVGGPAVGQELTRSP
jgi:hypothetical protein